MLDILSNRTYRHLFAAQVIALIGTGLATVALGLLAFELAGDDAGLVLGTALAIKMVAYVGIAPIATAMAQRLRPQVAILDIGMPGMDGNTVARCIRDSLPDERMLMVAVTGRGLAQDRAHTRAAGFDHHFTKPVALGELFGRLVSWRDELNASARE